MRVLVVHNNYRTNAPSGETMVVNDEVARLREAGVDVQTFYRDSDDIVGPLNMLGAAVRPVWAPRSGRDVARAIKQFEPDVMHVHNLLPLIGLTVLRVAAELGVPSVHTVHNYRHSCINGLHVRDGRTCTDCLGHRFPAAGVAHSCYQGSSLRSLPTAIGVAVHRSSWQLVSRFLVLTPFMAKLAAQAGLPADRMVMHPTSARDPGAPTQPGRDALVLGRLEEAKGIGTILRAWLSSQGHDRRLIFAGDGIMRADVESAVASRPDIEYRGLLGPEDVATEIKKCGLVAIPSLALEGLPRVLVEAASHGRAAMVPGHGSLASVVDGDTGWVVANSVDGWRAGLAALADNEITQRGDGAYRRFTKEWTDDVSVKRLLGVYESVIGAGR